MRVAEIQRLDLELFDFDYDLTFMVFFLGADGQVTGRFGGRDHESADSRMSIGGLKYAMEAALEAHRNRDQDATLQVPEKEPRTLADYPRARPFMNSCIHCHQAKEILISDQRSKGQWTRDNFWRFPLPENVGFSLEVEQGLAFKSDISRIATYQIASEGGTAPTNNLSKRIGIAKDLHQLSHAAAKDEDGFKDWGMWDQFVARQLAYFVNRLAETPEGDGRLLDRCLIFQGAATSKIHDNTNYPIIMAGGKQMGHKAGQFITYDEEKNALSNLFVRIANSMDVPMENFGDSSGIPMSELFV